MSERGDNLGHRSPGNHSVVSRQYSSRERLQDNSFKKKKKLDDIEEVYEELNGFLAHTKMAFLSFFSLIYFVLRITIGSLFFRVIFPILEKILYGIFLVMVFICTILAFIGNQLGKLKNKNKSLNPFMDQNKMQRIQKFDKIFENKRFTLVLDLDGTLVHSARTRKPKVSKTVQYDRITMNVLGQGKQAIHLYSRPHLDEFLSKLGEKFNLAVFSASDECYCDAVIDHIDKWRAIQHRFYKHHVDINHKVVAKDLTKIMKGKLDNVIMIEDAPGVCVQRENTIIINRWSCENSKDSQLKLILDVLLENVDHAVNAADLINIYRQKLNEDAMRDVTLDFSAQKLDIPAQETDNENASIFDESTIKEGTELSFEESRQVERSPEREPSLQFENAHVPPK